LEWRIELHTHTTVSDGSVSPEELVRLAYRKRLAGIAITDHNTFRGSILGSRALKIHDINLIILYGNEVRTSWGDVLVICSQPPSGEPPRDPFQLREWSSYNGCILIAAHPYHLARSSIWFKVRKYSGLFDAIEVWNPRGIPLLNMPAMIDVQKLGKPGVSGSDSHVAAEVGVAPVVLDWEPSSADEVVEAIVKGRVKPTIAIPPFRAYLEMAAWAIARRFKAAGLL